MYIVPVPERKSVEESAEWILGCGYRYKRRFYAVLPICWTWCGHRITGLDHWNKECWTYFCTWSYNIYTHVLCQGKNEAGVHACGSLHYKYITAYFAIPWVRHYTLVSLMPIPHLLTWHTSNVVIWYVECLEYISSLCFIEVRRQHLQTQCVILFLYSWFVFCNKWASVYKCGGLIFQQDNTWTHSVHLLLYDYTAHFIVV